MRSLSWVLFLCILGASAVARSDEYPDKSIRLIVPYPAGGGTDIAARWIAQKLGDRLKRQIIVDNRGGANGNLGTDLIAKAPADGYTIGMGTPGPVSVGRSLYPSLPYDPLKDLVPIIVANASPIVLVVNTAVPAKTTAELVALAKASPGKLTAALVSTGSVPHLVTEVFKGAAGVDILDVPYKGGGPATIDVMGGQVDMLFSVLPLVLPHIKSGKLRALAVASESRSDLLPDVPTLRELGYGQVVGSAWNGVVAPAGTPQAIVAKLNKEIATILATPETKTSFAALGMEAVGGSPQSFATFLKAETEKWAAVIKSAHIQPE
jgi:tripartite-type tricarboxylate transporter receptor subunit TctC